MMASSTRRSRKLFDEKIPAHFVQYAADILGDTSSGLSAANIVRATVAYAVEYDVMSISATKPATMLAREPASCG